MKNYFLPAIAAALLVNIARAATYNVNTIEDLVNAIGWCSDGDYGAGDVINLAEGVYDVANLIEINKKAIRIVGAGKGKTILDGGYSADSERTSGIFNVTKEGVVISGITFRNASRGLKDGGAIYINSNNYRFEVVDCVFSNCHAKAGGGIASSHYYNGHHAQDEGYFPPRGDMGVIAGCDFVNCEAHGIQTVHGGDNGGGAVLGGFWIENSTFDSCVAYGYASMVFTDQHMMVTNCTFSNCPNVTEHPRGGIYLNRSACELRILDCKFSGMTCSPLLARTSNRAFVDRCVFTNCAGETTDSVGGLVRLSGRGYFRNCLIQGNQNPFSLTSESFENCTIAGNVGGFCITAQNGGQISASFTNCVIASNSRWDNAEYTKGGPGICWSGADVEANVYAGMKIANCAFEGVSYLSDVIGLDASGVTERVSRDVDIKGPRFKDAANGDFSLKGYSALVDAGIKADWMDSACDIAGNKRCLKRGLVSDGALPDIGCYEFYTIAGFKISFR